MNEPKTKIFDIGDQVYCDLCGEDYTHSDETGGFLFLSKGVCPKCAPGFMKTIKACNKKKYIKALNNNQTPFREFILKIRDGDNRVIIRSWK
jgi:hypothetical protein